MVLDREKIKQAKQLTNEEYDCLMRHYRPEDKDFIGPERIIRDFEDFTEEEKYIDDHIDEGLESS